MKKIIILSLCFMLSDFCAPAFAQGDTQPARVSRNGIEIQ